MLGLVKVVDGEENAGKVVGVDRNHESWTCQASPEPGTETAGTVACRDRWSEAVMAEENGGSRSSDVRAATSPRDREIQAIMRS